MATTKYYRVKKDTFMWDEGAILKYDGSLGGHGGYQPVSDIWNAIDLKDVDEYISGHIIENNPEWFERVYEISVFGKITYGTKEAAKAAATKLFKEK